MTAGKADTESALLSKIKSMPAHTLTHILVSGKSPSDLTATSTPPMEQSLPSKTGSGATTGTPSATEDFVFGSISGAAAHSHAMVLICATTLVSFIFW